VNKFNPFEPGRARIRPKPSQAGRLNLLKLLKSAYPKLTTKFMQLYFNPNKQKQFLQNNGIAKP
jgi:hypothetical protein